MALAETETRSHLVSEANLERVQQLLEETDALIAAIEPPIRAIHDAEVVRNLHLLAALQNQSYEAVCADFGLGSETAPAQAPANDRGRKISHSRAREILKDSERIIALVRQGKRPKDIFVELGLTTPTERTLLFETLRELGLDIATRRHIQEEANPSIALIRQELEKLGKERKVNAGGRTAKGFLSPHLLGLVDELNRIYEISLEEIADKILASHPHSLSVTMTRYRNEKKDLPPAE